MNSPVDVIILGDALNDCGFVASNLSPIVSYNILSGLSLNTFGFLWDCQGIWVDNDLAFGISINTVWTYEFNQPNGVGSCTD